MGEDSMMTAKHFEALAQAINRTMWDYGRMNEFTDEALENLVNNIMMMCENDNHRFNRDLFRDKAFSGLASIEGHPYPLRTEFAKPN